MKRIVTWLLALMLCLLLVSAASAGQYYQIGDRMDDFSVTLSTGETVTLYGLLETKQAVMLNFWATWCGPCRMEFPALQEAYAEYQDQVEVLALSVEANDTAEVINQFKEQNGITLLHMASDTQELGEQFFFQAIPTSVLVDRNGVVCWMSTGSVTDPGVFKRLFAGFVGDDYAVSKVNYVIPEAAPSLPRIDEDELTAAVVDEGSAVRMQNSADEMEWPFVLQDGAIAPGNIGVQSSTASISAVFEAKAGDVIAFDYRMHTAIVTEPLLVSLNGEVITALSGNMDNWQTYAHRIETDGSYQLTMSYIKGSQMQAGGEVLMLDHVRLASGEAADAVLASMPAEVHSLSGSAIEVQPVSNEARAIVFDDPAGTLKASLPFEAAYLVPDRVGTFRVCIGEDVDPYQFLFFGDNDGTMQNIWTAEMDDKGYLFTTALSSVQNGGYSNTFVEVYPQPSLNSRIFTRVLIFRSEDDLNYFCDLELPAALSLHTAWHYADEAAEAVYRIEVQGADGQGLAGALVQFCDDATCEVLTTDENGVVSMSRAPYAYEVHVLSAPAGYAADPSRTYVFDVAGGTLTIQLDQQ